MQAIAAFRDSTAPRFVAAPPPRTPAAGEVLCRTLELGVCGTDREILHSARPWTPEGCDHLILGHECLARIEALGPGVTEFAVGDLVVPQVRRALPGAHPGATPPGATAVSAVPELALPLNSPAARVISSGAREGEPPTSTADTAVAPRTAGINPAAGGDNHVRVDMLAFGQFIERGIVFAHGFSAPLWLDEPRYLYPVKPELRPFAVLTEPLAVAEKGVHEALLLQRARLGDGYWSDPPPRVLVTGLGPIGFAAALACLRRGWPVALYGRDDAESGRARLARAFGARYLSRESDLSPADAEADGFDLLLECTGSEEVLLPASHAVAARGVLVWLGSTRVPRPRPSNVAQMIRDGLLRNHLHVGSVNAAPRDFLAALADLDALRQSHPRELAALITARVSPAEALWHYEHRAKDGIKTVVELEGNL